MKSKLNLEMGARNNAKTKREINDFYATAPVTVEKFLAQIGLDNIEIPGRIWECACGMGHISRILEKYGYNVFSSDLIDRGYGHGHIDFLQTKDLPQDVKTIITNPPYKFASEFVLHALELLPNNGMVIMYVKDRFLEGRARFNSIFLNNRPKYVYCHVNRQKIAMNGDFLTYCQSAGSQFYIWAIWQKGYNGDTKLRWII